MTLNTLHFLLFFTVVLAVYSLSAGRRWRQLVLFAASLYFIGIKIHDPLSWIALAGICLSGYCAARRADSIRRFDLFAAIYLVVSILCFLVIKKYEIVTVATHGQLLDHAIIVLGYSYIMFKQIHVVVDASAGTIQGLSLFTYINYLLGFYTLLAGPIQRYNDFSSCWNETNPTHLTRQQTLDQFNRFVNGLLKAFVIAPFFGNLSDSAALTAFLKEEHASNIFSFLTLFYSAPLFVFFNFAGYCDIVIAAGKLLGITLPENFDRPWLSRNMIDFWNRWHITLSYWLRDYVFNPSYKALASRFARGRLLAVCACYMLALMVSGLWHGTTLAFIGFGFVHGVGVCAAKIWEDFLKWRLGKKGLDSYRHNLPIRIAAIFLTLNYASFAFLFFTFSLDEIQALWTFCWR